MLNFRENILNSIRLYMTNVLTNLKGEACMFLHFQQIFRYIATIIFALFESATIPLLGTYIVCTYVKMFFKELKHLYL